MEQESLNEATRLVVDVIQNSNINVVDKLELLMNINNFLENYHEAIKSDLGRKKWKAKTKTKKFSL